MATSYRKVHAELIADRNQSKKQSTVEAFG